MEKKKFLFFPVLLLVMVFSLSSCDLFNDEDDTDTSSNDVTTNEDGSPSSNNQDNGDSVGVAAYLASTAVDVSAPARALDVAKASSYQGIETFTLNDTIQLIDENEDMELNIQDFTLNVSDNSASVSFDLSVDNAGSVTEFTGFEARFFEDAFYFRFDDISSDDPSFTEDDMMSFQVFKENWFYIEVTPEMISDIVGSELGDVDAADLFSSATEETYSEEQLAMLLDAFDMNIFDNLEATEDTLDEKDVVRITFDGLDEVALLNDVIVYGEMYSELTGESYDTPSEADFDDALTQIGDILLSGEITLEADTSYPVAAQVIFDGVSEDSEMYSDLEGISFQMNGRLTNINESIEIAVPEGGIDLIQMMMPTDMGKTL